MHPLLNFNSEKLLLQALTHRSYFNENPQSESDNERLEFLGDALINFVAGEYVYRRYPNQQEDKLSRKRSALVDEKQLAKFAEDVGITFRMRLGEGAKKDGGYYNKNLLSSTFEAVIGGYYIDQNYNIRAVQKILVPLFDSVPMEQMEIRSTIDSKNRLQAYIQANYNGKTPIYETIKTGGSEHDPEFTATVLINGEILGQAKAKSKKEAEKRSAENALANLTRKQLLKD